MSKFIIVIHAREGSQRVKNKALRRLGDKPLIFHSIDTYFTFLNANYYRSSDFKLVIDTDSDAIINRCKAEYGDAIDYLKRPKALATSRITGDDLMYWQAENYPDSVAIIQKVPTSPFLSWKSLQRGINLIHGGAYTSVVSVQFQSPYYWTKKIGQEYYMPFYAKYDTIPNSQDVPKVPIETSGLYGTKTDFILDKKRRLCYNKCGFVEVSPIEAIDINTEYDLSLAEAVYKGLS